MQETTEFDVIIIGGGLAGLSCACLLGNNFDVLLIEKESFPHHKVCGEYISNEVLPVLQALGVDPFELGAKDISKLQLTTHNGREIKSELPLGGFGISRYTLDHALYQKAESICETCFDAVIDIQFVNDVFTVTTKEYKSFQSHHVIGAFGKRSNLDKVLNRPFFQQKSPWLAVKAHYEYAYPEDTVALHNFEGGYCGLSQIETGAVNACYLTTYAAFKKTNGIVDFQHKTLSKNPYLKEFFQSAVPIFPEPLTISQVSFQKKEAVKQHIFMIGDSAGLIHPLCGNGMAMAIHSAKILTDVLKTFELNTTRRSEMEIAYAKAWKKQFQNRLKTGERVQRLLLQPTVAKAAYNVVKAIPSILPKIIKRTHGDYVT